MCPTVTFIDSFPVPHVLIPTAVKFNTDGTKMFVTGTGNNNALHALFYRF